MHLESPGVNSLYQAVLPIRIIESKERLLTKGPDLGCQTKIEGHWLVRMEVMKDRLWLVSSQIGGCVWVKALHSWLGWGEISTPHPWMFLGAVPGLRAEPLLNHCSRKAGYPVAPAKAQQASVLPVLLAQGSLLEAGLLQLPRLSSTFRGKSRAGSPIRAAPDAVTPWAFTLTEVLKTKSVKEFIFKFETGDFRLLHMDQGWICVGLHDYLVSFSQSTMNREPLIITWPASPEKEKTCRMKVIKGQENLCFNFIHVIQQLNRTHLLVCGTGAFSPICTIANRGRDP
ncbi:uncharacterized protein LOC119929552 [Tachyglossus aculeatus]|uniref:uncharacterized protein LOC119929552 n=1 Tax=Tachyglossus aculeatus TaxID=9261 RepID=UPI0018F5EFCB|nr:uncharacterized protein LOC119929552 [Tachyglossus aculeatus]